MTAITSTATVSITPEVQVLIDKINEANTKGEPLPGIKGAFGDMEDCSGLIELPILQPPTGGTFLKLYSCPFLYKGFPTVQTVDMMNIPKAMLSRWPREIVTNSFFIKTFLVIFFLFNRRHFYHTIRTIFQSSNDLFFEKIRYPSPHNFCSLVRSLRNSFNETVRRVYDYEVDSKMVLYEQTDYKGKRDFIIALASLMEAVYLILEFDNAYRFRFQDIIVEMKREAIEKNVRKEVLRLITLAKGRETGKDMQNKWKAVYMLANAALFLSRKTRKFVRTFLLDIDIEAMKMDESDYYFSLARQTFNFRGESLEQRLKKKEEIDAEKGIISMQIVQMRQPDGSIKDGFRIKPKNGTTQIK